MRENFKSFLKLNRLSQRDIAEFLGVTDSAVSNICRGLSKPSPENFEKIINNDRGWDTTPLTSSSPMVSVNASGDSTAKVTIGSHNNISYSAEVEVLRGEVKMLREMLAQKEGEIEFLRSLLTSK